MRSAGFDAELIERDALGQAVGERLVVVGEEALDLERRLGQHAPEEVRGSTHRFLGPEFQVDPAGGAVDGDEEIATAGLVRPLW